MHQRQSGLPDKTVLLHWWYARLDQKLILEASPQICKVTMDLCCYNNNSLGCAQMVHVTLRTLAAAKFILSVELSQEKQPVIAETDGVPLLKSRRC